MEPITVWTAIASIAAVASIVVGIALFVAKRIRDGDVASMKALKADLDHKIINVGNRADKLDDKVTNVYTNVQMKLDKAEHQMALAKIDKEIEGVRRDHNTGITRIENKLDKLYDMLMQLFKDK